MSIFQQTIRGIAWVSAAKIVAQIIGTGVSIALARILAPSDFGLVAMIYAFTGFVAIFGELGLGAALVQRDDLTEEQLSSVFWINILAGAALGGIVAAGAPFLARFYDEPRLLRLTLVMAINFVIAPLNMVHNALLARSMRFSAVVAVETAAMITSAILVVVLALLGFGVWSLVAQGLCSTVVATCGIWTVSKWRPTRVLKWSAVRDLIRFSANLLGFSVINYWARKSDDLLVGKVMGAAKLGIYDRAYSTMMLPLNEVAGVLGKVMFPALSKMQSDKERVKAYYLRALSMIALLTFPMMLVLSVLADPIILVLYGPKWAPVSSVLKILCVVGMFQSIGTTVGWLYQSQGRTDVMFRWGAVASLLIIASLATGVYIGTLEALAACYAVMTVGVLSYPQFAIPGKLIGMKVREVVGAVSGVLVCAAATAAVVWVIDRHAIPTLRPGARIAMLIPGAAVFYIALLRAFRVDAYMALRGFILEWRQKRAAARGAPDTSLRNP
jgi:PST family polysaccharide transporter